MYKRIDHLHPGVRHDVHRDGVHQDIRGVAGTDPKTGDQQGGGESAQGCAALTFVCASKVFAKVFTTFVYEGCRYEVFTTGNRK